LKHQLTGLLTNFHQIIKIKNTELLSN